MISRLFFVVPGAAFVTEDLDVAEVLPPSCLGDTLGCSDVTVLMCPHRRDVEGVLGWSWPTSRASGSGACPTGASRSTTMLPSSPR